MDTFIAEFPSPKLYHICSTLSALLTLDEAEIIANVRAGMERLAQRQPDKRIQVYNP